jgi:hypothetical protein
MIFHFYGTFCDTVYNNHWIGGITMIESNGMNMMMIVAFAFSNLYLVMRLKFEKLQMEPVKVKSRGH